MIIIINSFWRFLYFHNWKRKKTPKNAEKYLFYCYTFFHLKNYNKNNITNCIRKMEIFGNEKVAKNAKAISV
tara:strand:- start:153 stop:368 length:216 start_codon:yes stop_codon:yes gene_type:complete